jgi:hypothetical protein
MKYARSVGAQLAITSRALSAAGAAASVIGHPRCPLSHREYTSAGAHSLDCGCAECQLARVRDGHRDGWPRG